ncbi:WD40 repeat, partial [Brachionus plicatilis]
MKMREIKLKKIWGKWKKNKENFNRDYHQTFAGDFHVFGYVKSLEILQNGNIVSGSEDQTIKIWHKDTFECLKTINGHNSEVNCLAIMQNGNIVSGSWDKTIKIWDKDTFECLKTIN